MSSTAVAHTFEVEIVYNGTAKELRVELHERIEAIVQHAAHLFGITQNVHLLALFRKDGSEIAVDQSAETAGIKRGELLALRPSAVRGG
jgi:predicted O-linked N-acetylglucosamine transferase (SPINDLY family)